MCHPNVGDVVIMKDENKNGHMWKLEGGPTKNDQR